jgi:hypothetical protein
MSPPLAFCNRLACVSGHAIESSGTKDQKQYKHNDNNAHDYIDHHGASEAGAFLRGLDWLLHR